MNLLSMPRIVIWLVLLACTHQKSQSHTGQATRNTKCRRNSQPQVDPRASPFGCFG